MAIILVIYRNDTVRIKISKMPEIPQYDPEKNKLPKLPEKSAEDKERAQAILQELYDTYPEPGTALHHRNAFELLIATILSAQCTDERVNKVTPGLFEKYPDPQAFVDAPIEDIQEEIRSTGFFKNKAKAIKESSKTLVEEFGGEVPPNMDDLLKLRGVARKTASVVLGNVYGMNVGIVVDTHVKRISYRFGLTENQKNPDKIEKELMALFPQESWTDLPHMLIDHGRNVCKARIKEPPEHPLCEKYGVNCECRVMRAQQE